jgi:hypothetical protein
MQKPSRFLLDKVSSYAEEGSAYLRRRRLRSRPFVRIWAADGSIIALTPADAEAASLVEAAERLLVADEPAA